MPTTFLNPPGVHDTGGRYMHTALITGSGRRLVVSGQVGMAPDGTVPADGPGQMAQALANLGTLLAAHAMTVANIVKITVFLTDPALIPAWRAARAGFMGTHVSTSTLLVVAALADPRWVVEIEIEALD